MKRLDLTGQKFGKLTAVEFVPGGKSSWRCRCECGEEPIVSTGNLRSGNSKSCGCANGEQLHGLYGSPEYLAFRNAKNRCNRPQDVRYEHYGGRGIKFRFSSFAEFLDTIGRRPSSKFSLDRIDLDGHYEPGNVRWATRKAQANNKTNNILVEIDGTTRSLKEWCDAVGQKYKRAHERISYGGWNPVDAIFTPAGETPKR